MIHRNVCNKKNVSIVEAIILGSQTKIEVFLSSQALNDIKYFPNLRILRESEKISDCDLEVYDNLFDE